MKILVIEDEQALASSIIAYLSKESYRCELATGYQEALRKIESFQYDCILLDITLPDGNGLKLLEQLDRQKNKDGVIIISARDSLEDKINGLQWGADDYLTKPFHLQELAARIYSVLRRRQFDNTNLIAQNELSIDILAKTVAVNGEPVVLTKTEFELLIYFIGNKNRVISKTTLAEHLSGEFADLLDNYDFIYAHIKNLKRKLAAAGCDNYLKTVYGTGYKWQV